MTSRPADGSPVITARFRHSSGIGASNRWSGLPSLYFFPNKLPSAPVAFSASHCMKESTCEAIEAGVLSFRKPITMFTASVACSVVIPVFWTIF